MSSDNPLDCFDEEMPLKTCAETAVRIKQVIEYCPKFIFLATEDALSSKWCNWEVGIADKWKLTGNNMAILPLLEKGKEPKSYKGNEYLQIYPYIETALNLTGSGSHLVVNCPTSSGWKQFEFRNWLYNQLND